MSEVDQEIMEKECISALSIFSDSMLNFKEHILTRIKKTNAMLGVVARNL